MDTSVTGKFRTSLHPNKPVQDGLKLPLFCEECEHIFSIFEKKVSEKFYTNFINIPSKEHPYENWLLKFAVSISFRTLLLMKTKGLANFSNERKNLNKALDNWRNFLHAEKELDTQYEHHIIPLSIISRRNNEPLHPNFNTYLMRCLAFDMVKTSDKKNLFIFSKMGPLLILGFIKNTDSSQWKGTKITEEQGYLKGPFTIPKNLLDFLIIGAEKFRSSASIISENQRNRIEKSYIKNSEKMPTSETLEALNRDIKLFGSSAFL